MVHEEAVRTYYYTRTVTMIGDHNIDHGPWSFSLLVYILN